MEQLSILEKKIALLIENKKNDARRLQDLTLELEVFREENAQLLLLLEETRKTSGEELKEVLEQNTSLSAQVEKLEETLLVRHQNLEALNQERELAKMAVDDLIKDIDLIVKNEQPQ